jgi:sugar lactone lactonase YvrE
LASAFRIKFIILFATFFCFIVSCSNKENVQPPSPSNPSPIITNFSPANGVAGDQIVITGSNFGLSTSGNIVKFNNTAATVVSASANQLTVTVPNGATTGKITITANGQTATSASDFVIIIPPTISGFIPTIGKPGDQIIINGTNFNTVAANNLVSINGTNSTVVNALSTQLTVIIPVGATSGTISVTANGRTTISSFTLTVLNSFVSTFAGSAPQGLQDGMGTSARFSSPEGIARDASGNMYVADQYNRSIRKITPSGLVSTLVTISNPSSVPTGIAVDGTGNIFVADRNLNLIWKISPIGSVTSLAGAGPQGYADGQGAAAKFNLPTDLTIDVSGNIYVADVGNRKIRKVTPTGLVSTFAGSDTSQTYDGVGPASLFNSPRGIAIDASGNLYVSDYDRIRKITPSAVVSTITGNAGAGFADGPVFSAKFFNPKGLAIDPSGNIFIAEKTRIRKITSDGFVITIAGTGNYGFADGLGSVAEFDLADGIIIDASGNLFIADASNNRIRKITF